MKLRFRGNTVRLRVNRREADTLASGAPLEESVAFPGDTRLMYALETRNEEAPGASFERNVIRISAPLAKVENWARGDEIGLYFDLAANGATLKIAIEKDLECVDGPIEERDPEAFPRRSGNGC